jgi:tetratricopeptide (TPR) repeat protein
MQNIFKLVFLIILLGHVFVLAQEKDLEIEVEDSAEVFLEEYSDEFEEAFFEGLKQKGIENYDRAINLFLECKKLDDENDVIDHELANAYFLDKNYNLASDYAVAALISEPENAWYLNTLVKILNKQGSSIEDLEMKIVTDNSKLQENLATIYFKKKKYESALVLVKKLKKTKALENLESNIISAIKERDKDVQVASYKSANTISDAATDVIGYKERIEGLMQTNNHMLLKQVATDALENFPSQPFFYYAQGYAFTKTGKHKEAIEPLEAALDYIINDISMANKIYTTLAEAYNGINNSEKANMYLRKVKSGF